MLARIFGLWFSGGGCVLDFTGLHHELRNRIHDNVGSGS